MALDILTPLQTSVGIELATSYGRVAVLNGAKGDIIEASVEIFASEAAFEAGAQPLVVYINLGARKAYDYTTDSKDILDFAHDMLIETLGAQGVNATKNL